MNTSGGNRERVVFRRAGSVITAGMVVLAIASGVAVRVGNPDRRSDGGGAVIEVNVRRHRQKPSLVAAAEDIRREKDPMRRDERLTVFIENLDVARIPTLLVGLRALGDEPVDEVVVRLLRGWAESDSETAAAWAAALPESELRFVALEQVALAWASHDLHEAAAWVRSLPAGAERENAMVAVGNDAVRMEPFAAIALGAELPASAARDELLWRATMEWATMDAPAAADWARMIEDETLRSRVLAGVALASGETDPVAAATLVASELPAGRPQSDAVVGVIQRWAARDPAAAAAWVDSFPAGTLRRDATARLMEQWTRSAPGDAARWYGANGRSND